MVTYIFTSDSIKIHAPSSDGVYFLYENGVLIYIGKSNSDTTSIRSRLLSHHSGAEGPCTKKASQFSFEVCTNPDAREVQLLESYESENGELPSCNDRVG